MFIYEYRFDTNEELIQHLVEDGVLKTPHIIEAFKAVDRIDFVPEEYQSEAYYDHALPIGYDQTISQPFTVAIMLEMLQPQKGDHVLDVGSGSGWTTALLAQITGSPDNILGVELVAELVEYGRNNIAKYYLPSSCIVNASKDRIGSPRASDRFDKILVSAASSKIPQDLIDQLAIGGTMVLPVNNILIRVHRISKTEIEKHELGAYGFVFVPLIGQNPNEG
jgi:protein-L-isoaspartate(D-aspartate) O-methyltransferase